MITEDIKLLEKIYDLIVNSLNNQSINYKDFIYNCSVDETYDVFSSNIVLIDSQGEQIKNKGIGRTASEVMGIVQCLLTQMSNRNDCWKSMSLNFLNGKVTTNFSYQK